MPIIYSKVTVEPSVEPISLVEAKAHLRVDHSDEDSLIDILRKAAREIVEKHTNRSLITQTRVIKLDEFPCFDTIRLTHGPVQSLTSITYDDRDNINQTLSSLEYWTDFDSDIARIVVRNNWPSTYDDKPNVVQITYLSGYGDTGSAVPSSLRQAMLLILGHLYENRQQVIVSGSPTGAIEIPFGASVLMSSYVLEQSVIY